jgi:hypothetical protein
MRTVQTLLMTGVACLFFLAPAQARAQGCAPYCVAPRSASDVVCNFNNDYCGTPVGGVSLCPAACETGLCTGGGGHVVHGDADLFSSQDLEIELQATVAAIPQAGQNAAGLVTKYQGHSAGTSEWAVFVEKQGVWVLCGDGTGCIFSPPGSVQIGQPYCILARLRGNAGELWVNGALVASGWIARNAANTATPVVIGDSHQPGHANPFAGTIDEVRIGPLEVVVPATVDCRPDTLNHGSQGRWVTCYVELPIGQDVDGIDVASIRLNGTVPAEARPTAIGDHDGDGIPDLMVKFCREQVTAILPAGSSVPLTLTGEVAGVRFSGADQVRVISGGH